MSENTKFIADEKRFYGKYSSTVFQTIGMSYRPYRGTVIFVFLSGFLARFLMIYNTNILGYWIDSFCKGSDCKPLPKLMEGFDSSQFVYLLIGFSTVGFILNTVFRILISRVGTYAVSSLYDEVTYRTSRLPMGFFDTNPVGRMVTRFSSDYGSVFRMAGGPMGEFLCIVFDLILILALVSFASFYFIPLVIILVILNYYVYKLNKNYLRAERRDFSVSRAPAIAHFSETSQGSRAIKVFGKEKIFINRFGTFLKQFLAQKIKMQIALSLFTVQMTILASTMFLISGLLGLYLVKNNLASLGSAAVAFTFLMMTSVTVQALFEWIAMIEEALSGVERMDEYLRHDIEPGSSIPADAVFQTAHARAHASDNDLLEQHTATLPHSAAVEFSRVTFRYRADLPVILKDMSFQIRAGEHVGIIGRTGSGKSSVIQALFALYPLESGKIRVGSLEPYDHPVDKRIALSLFRNSISLISQEPIMFRSTLRDNLTADTTASDEKLIATLKMVYLEDWFASLGEVGLDFEVMEKGSNLSAGQRQLICLARCLLQNAPVVVMDEATSAIDPYTESIILKATAEYLKEKTQIIIAHRLSTIEKCDRVLWIDSGEVRMFDTTEKVLAVFRADKTASGEMS